MEDRRQRYANINRKVSKTNLLIDVNLDITALDLMCSYIISNNKNIRRGNVIQMRNLFEIIDMSVYGNDTERLNRIDFIKKGIEARLVYNLTDRNMIISHILGGFGIPADAVQYNELNNDELSWVNMSVSQILKDSIIYNDVDRGLALLTKFKAADFINRGPIRDEIEEWIRDMQVKFRRARANNQSEMRFSLVGDDYENIMRDTYRKLASPSNKLIFGTQALNALTGGGVESGRVYTLLGLPGEGKSTTLVDMAIQIKRYNANYICKDPTKKPCVVLLVMENSIKETVQRIFNMCTGNNMLDFTEDEAIEILKSKGNLMVSPTDPVNLFILYEPNLSIDTSYLYDMVEDLEDEGFETICVIQDYLKRIRSVDGTFGGDLRLQLGAIINEFKVFATLKDIPVITASQLNREATSHIDEARKTNKADLVRLLGRANVGESNLILENSDWIALIAPEYDNENNKYLGIQRVKSRYFIQGDFAYAYLPYINGTIKFIEDYYSPIPVHKITMRPETNFNNGITGNMNGVVNEIKEFTEFNNIKLPVDNSANLFLNATAVVAKQLVSNRIILARKVNNNN